MEVAVKIEKVSKRFSLEKKKAEYWLRNPFRKKRYPVFQALEDISFEVGKGETVGLIGLNGSGKSTLSNLIAGLTQPTEGTITREGVVSLLAIGAGLKPNLTGRENIYLKMLLMDYKKKEIEQHLEDIITFTELHAFIDQPIKQYSSGMKAKLGFGIAVQIDPDILIIDEALAVGDQTFYEKCLRKIATFKQAGKTIFFVSHSISQIKEMCDKTAWLHYGTLKAYGESESVCLEYSKFVHQFNKWSLDERKAYQLQQMAAQRMDDQWLTFGVRTKRAMLSQFFYVSVFLLIIGYSAVRMNGFSLHQILTIIQENLHF